jgi:predicted nucleic acid-binding protein
MAVLFDTNILLRLIQPHHPHSQIAARALRIFRTKNLPLHITQQNIVEFWAVTTRPILANGLGLTVEQAIAEVTVMKKLFQLLPELPLQSAWEQLVADYHITGKNAHDARLVAAMTVHRIDTLLTFNVQDFSRYKGIAVVDPASTG